MGRDDFVIEAGHFMLWQGVVRLYEPLLDKRDRNEALAIVEDLIQPFRLSDQAREELVGGVASQQRKRMLASSLIRMVEHHGGMNQPRVLGFYRVGDTTYEFAALRQASDPWQVECYDRTDPSLSLGVLVSGGPDPEGWEDDRPPAALVEQWRWHLADLESA